MDPVNLIFGLLGLAGTAGTFYFGIKAKTLERQRHRFSWEDISKGSQSLARKCIKQFKPDAILTFSGAGSVIANLALLESHQYLPIYTVIEIKRGALNSPSEIAGYTKLETAKWLLFFPEALSHVKHQRLAVIHDCTVSGDGLALIRSELLAMGFKAENIKLAVLICSQVSIDCKKPPDIYVHCLEHATFDFPWGERI